MKKNIKKKLTVGLCHGVFDVVHLGHINHFKSAKKICNHLVVSITKDKFIKKGINRPIFNEKKRYEFLKSINLIDEVYICETESAVDAIEKFKPDFYFKGPDYKNNKLDKTKKIYLEKDTVKKFKGKIIYTNDQKFSSSEIINLKSFFFSKEQTTFLNIIKKRFTLKKILFEIEKIKKNKSIILGEFIIDTYSFGNIAGKSGKEPHLVMSKLYNENYIGGAAAIAKNISRLINQTTFVSEIGKEELTDKIIRIFLKQNIKNYLIKPNNTYRTIVKKRFIDKVSNYKLLGYYDSPSFEYRNKNSRIYKVIKKNIIKNDTLIICDYGHYFFDKKIIEIIKKTKKLYKTANIQLNSLNLNSQNLKKFKNLDAFFVNQSELYFSQENKNIPFKNLCLSFKKEIMTRNLIVTRGKNGATLINKDNKFFDIPAFAHKSVDKVGAGDTLFAVSSVALGAKIDPLLSLFFGSLCAAKNIEFLGNKYFVDWNIIIDTLKYIYRK